MDDDKKNPGPKQDEQELGEDDESARGGALSSDETHTESGAPTDKAHRDDGDGSLTGSVPAGLTPDELRRIAEDDKIVEPGTG